MGLDYNCEALGFQGLNVQGIRFQTVRVLRCKGAGFDFGLIRIKP